VTLLPPVPLYEPAAAALVLLVSGHLLADFLLQNQGMADAKGERAGLMLLHGLLTLVTQLVVLFPLWSVRTLLVIIALGLLHVLQDSVKARLERGSRRPLLIFTADQLLHGATLLLAWLALRPGLPEARALFLLPSTWLAPYTACLLVAAGLAFNTGGGTAIVRKLLERYPTALPGIAEGGRDKYAMGRTIGVLERLLVFVLVLLNQWAALGLVLAAKSIARFKELERQVFADYYLIGTLTSLQVAVATGIIVRWILG
jgi:hypothetical protein